MNYCRKCTGEWKGKEMCKNCAKAKLEEAEMEGKYSYKLEESQPDSLDRKYYLKRSSKDGMNEEII